MFGEIAATDAPYFSRREVELRRYHVTMRTLALAAQQMAIDAGHVPLREACAAMVKLTDLSNQTGEQVNGGNVGDVCTKLRFLAHVVTHEETAMFLTLDVLRTLCMEQLTAGAKPETLATLIDPAIPQERLAALGIR